MSDYNVAPKGKGWNTPLMKAQFELDRYTEEYAAPHLQDAWRRCLVIVDTIRSLGPSPDAFHRCRFCLKTAYRLEDHHYTCVHRLAQELFEVRENVGIESKTADESSTTKENPMPRESVDPTLPFVPTFGWALQHLRRGDRVLRPGWNGKGMFLFLVHHWAIDDMRATTTGTLSMERLPFIAMKTADDKIVPWLASQTDILAEDWEILSPHATTHDHR